jgi:hypothetical protein
MKVLYGHRERRRRRSWRALARQALDVDSEIGRRKSETNNFRGKRELVATTHQVAVAIATQERLPVLAKAQMDRIRGLHRLAGIDHDVGLVVD